MKYVCSSRVAGAALLAMATFGSGPLWADVSTQDDIPPGRGPFPVGPLRQLDDALKPYGIRPSLTYIGETLSNASGGVRRGAIYDGQLGIGVDVNLEKLSGWSGAKFHANVLNNHGDGLSREYLGNNLMTVSSIEGLNHTRLDEFWIEQGFGKAFSLRFGQLSADVEFYNSKYANFLVNSTFGWPAITGTNLPAGGPVIPLSTMGVRAQVQLSDAFTLLLGVFDGNAAGRGTDDPQNLDPHGLNFRVSDPPLLMAELQYAYKLDASRPGTLKLGAWVHTGSFSDQRYDTNGVPLASPASNGFPAQHRGVTGPYVVLEQMLLPFDAQGHSGVVVYGRVNATQADRNAVDFYADGGVNITGFWPARPNDNISVGGAYARISSAARGFDQDTVTFGTPTTIRSYEAVLETTYSAQIASGWTVQPNLQYIYHPGGGAIDPTSASGKRIPDTLVLGMRMTVQWGARDPNSQQ